MKKKKIILLSLALVLLVLSFLFIKYFTHTYYYVNTEGQRISIDREDIETRRTCEDGGGEIYYIKEKDHEKNMEIWYLAKIAFSPCSDAVFYHKKNTRAVEVVYEQMYENWQDYDKAKKAAEKRLKDYLDKENDKCNNCILEVINTWPEMGTTRRYSDEKLLAKENKTQDNNENAKYLCESNSKTLEIGREMYPISDKYKSSECEGEDISCVSPDNILGELFTADDCGENRIKEIYGDTGDFHPFGLTIKLSEVGADNFTNTLSEIGFECSDGYEYNCLEWTLNKQVKTEDLLKLKKFYIHGYLSLNNVYLQHIDYNDNSLEISSNQSLYVSNDLGLKFIYADYDPYFGEKCIITEKGNKIENSCGFFIEVIEKDTETKPYDTVLSLIPDPNYCNIETFDDSITNFDWAYKITPKETAFSELNKTTDVSACGNYVSFGDNHAIHYNQDFPERLLITNWGGHEPRGTLEEAEVGKPVRFWVSTARFF